MQNHYSYPLNLLLLHLEAIRLPVDILLLILISLLIPKPMSLQFEACLRVRRLDPLLTIGPKLCLVDLF